MIKKSLLTLLLTFIFTSTFLSQTQPTLLYHGEYSAQKNDINSPCISKSDYELMERRCDENIQLHRIENQINKKTVSTALSWPIKMATGLSDCGFYSISNYVDQDVTSGIRDYNCGTRTYNGHRGIDIVPQPYQMYKMDHNEVEVIAAAAGTIIDKQDGNFDRNCTLNNVPANYVIVQHADGSRALYYHMKLNSVTAKLVGQTVSAGEYLGTVGSSGYSNGPHLHFEVWAGSTSGSLVDPYAGTCNLLNGVSWWASQKPYTEPSVIKLQTGRVPPVLNACPIAEVPNEESCFLTDSTAKMVVFFRNETIGLATNLRVINPNGSTLTSWTYTSTNNFLDSYIYWNLAPLPATPGSYTFEVIYNGQTCTKTFSMNCSTVGVKDLTELKGLSISPNPNNGHFVIESEKETDIVITNALGQTVLTTPIQKGRNDLNLDGKSNGLYFIKNGGIVYKIIKQ